MKDLFSTIDWCESNYTVSEYVAEYWNTVTGIFLILSGLIFSYVKKKSIKQNNLYIRKRFKNIQNLLVLVGIGTMLFHGTLWYPFQLLDELPMVYLATEYIKILLDLQTTQNCFNISNLNIFRKIVVLTSILPIFISLSYFIDPSLQIISFHITLKLTEISVIILLYTLSTNLNKISYEKIYKKNDIYNNNNVMLSSLTNHKNIQINKSHLLKNVQQDIFEYIELKRKISYYTRSGLFYYGISVSIWCIENLFCNYIEHFQLHAFWHILSSIGIYNLNNIILCHTLINRNF